MIQSLSSDSRFNVPAMVAYLKRLSKPYAALPEIRFSTGPWTCVCLTYRLPCPVSRSPVTSQPWPCPDERLCLVSSLYSGLSSCCQGQSQPHVLVTWPPHWSWLRYTPSWVPSIPFAGPAHGLFNQYPRACPRRYSLWLSWLSALPKDSGPCSVTRGTSA